MSNHEWCSKREVYLILDTAWKAEEQLLSVMAQQGQGQGSG